MSNPSCIPDRWKTIQVNLEEWQDLLKKVARQETYIAKLEERCRIYKQLLLKDGRVSL